jgi:hypothetical protein
VQSGRVDVADLPLLADETLIGALPVLYLDQSAWVRLARAEMGTEPAFVPLLSTLKRAREEQRVVIALGGLNYLELWHRRGADSRKALSRTMANLTGYATLAPVHRLAERDLLGALGLPHDAAYPIGVGADHAFGSPLGRFRIVQSIATSDEEEGPELKPSDDLLRMRSRADPRAWEWGNLAGFDDDAVADGIDMRPEHRIGSAFAADQESLRSWAAGVDGPASLYRALVAQTLGYVADGLPQDATQELMRRGRWIAETIGVLNDAPTLAVFTELLFRAHQNGQYRFRQHDRADILALAQALPICDVVWADRHWAATTRAAHLDRHYGTVVVDTPDALLRWFDGPGPTAASRSPA